MTLFESMVKELLFEQEVDDYIDKIKQAQEKISKYYEDYQKQMQSPIAKKMLSYLIGFNLIFDLKQKFSEGTKSFKVRDLDNEREKKANLFAEKYDSEVEYNGTTPIVKIDDYKFIFKNASSVGGNAGHEFEREITSDLKNKNLDNDVIKKITEELDISIDDIKEVESIGERNTKRPISISDNKIEFVGINDINDIGERVSDIDIIIDKDGEEEVIHLSLKTSNTITFINAGLGSPGPNNQKMRKLFNALGIDEEKAVQGFYNYQDNEGEKPEIEDFNADEDEYKRLLKFAMGANYLYVHKKHVMFIDDKKNAKMIANPRNFTVQYSGKGRKRIDIKFETDGFSKVNFNIRNKQGGLWPSHIMCDYTIK